MEKGDVVAVTYNNRDYIGEVTGIRKNKIRVDFPADKTFSFLNIQQIKAKIVGIKINQIARNGHIFDSLKKIR